MLARPPLTVDPLPIPPVLPDWARPVNGQSSAENAVFAAGAALGAIHATARNDHPITKIWRQRLALNCTQALTRMEGRGVDTGTLRDHFCLTRPGDDPGPAGRMLAAWRSLGSRRASRPAEWRALLADLPDVLIDETADDALDHAVRIAEGDGSPIVAVADVVSASLTAKPDSRAMALWLGDAVLARRLKWPVPVPLLAGHLKRDELRFATGPAADEAAWRTACASAYVRGAAVAFDLYCDLARRAENLIAVAPKLRGKDAADIVQKLLSEDALAAQSGRTTSDRSSRRLFDRLVDLGVVRELTGRSTFRLYGL